MKERILIALFAALSLGGCLKILGDYDLEGTDPPKAGAHATDAVACWKRAADGLCACQATPPTAEYDASPICAASGSGGKCCGFDNWPSAGTCLCVEFRCLELTDNPESCVCGHYAVPEPDSGYMESSYCSGAGASGCCSGPGVCYCNGAGTTCDADAGEVTASGCDPSQFADSVPCGDGGVTVTECR